MAQDDTTTQDQAAGSYESYDDAGSVTGPGTGMDGSIPECSGFTADER